MLLDLEATRERLGASRAKRGPAAEWTPELERRLEALGYLESPSGHESSEPLEAPRTR
jgi:hypothetical protein